MVPKNKIAFFINSLASAGAEKVVSILLNSFSDEYEVHLILLNNIIEVPVNRVKMPVTIIDTDRPSEGSKVFDILKIPLLASRLKTYLTENKIDICISFLNRSNFIACFAKKTGWKGKLIICERAHTSSVYNNHSIAGKTGRFLVRRLYKNADLIITNAIGQSEDLRETYRLKNKITVIYNPIDLDQHAVKSAEPVTDFTFTKFTFILSGRFHPQKNHSLLLHAVTLIKHLDFEVLLIGRGPGEQMAKNLAAELGIENKIKFLGFKANPIKYAAAADCTIMSSDYEGFPNVLLESLASGTPVISTDCPTGPRELLSGEFKKGYASHAEYLPYGILVPAGNREILAAEMKNMLTDAELLKKYAAVSRSRAADFRRENIIAQFRAALQSLL